MSGKNVKDILIFTLLLLRGKAAWDVNTETGVYESVIRLDLGWRRKVGVPATGTFRQRDRYEGEFVLFIECAWRFELDGKIVCGSRSDEELEGEVSQGIRPLVGWPITDVTVDSESLDLVLTFGSENGRLVVFCDAVDPDDETDNYSVTVDDATLVVGPKSEVRQVPLRTARTT